MKNLQLKQHNILKEIITDLTWNYEYQIKQGDIYKRKATGFKACKIIFTSLTAIGIILSIFINVNMLKVFTAVISIVPLVLSATDSTIDYYKLNTVVNDDAESINILIEKGISILYDVNYNLNSTVNIQKEIDKLTIRRNKLYDSMIIPSKTAKKLALKNFNENIEDLEEDSLIPEDLRTIKVEI